MADGFFHKDDLLGILLSLDVVERDERNQVDNSVRRLLQLSCTREEQGRLEEESDS